MGLEGQDGSPGGERALLLPGGRERSEAPEQDHESPGFTMKVGLFLLGTMDHHEAKARRKTMFLANLKNKPRISGKTFFQCHHRRTILTSCLRAFVVYLNFYKPVFFPALVQVGS